METSDGAWVSGPDGLIRFYCPNGHRLKAHPKLAGQEFICTHRGCGQVVVVQPGRRKKRPRRRKRSGELEAIEGRATSDGAQIGRASSSQPKPYFDESVSEERHEHPTSDTRHAEFVANQLAVFVDDGGEEPQGPPIRGDWFGSRIAFLALFPLVAVPWLAIWFSRQLLFFLPPDVRRRMPTWLRNFDIAMQQAPPAVSITFTGVVSALYMILALLYLPPRVGVPLALIIIGGGVYLGFRWTHFHLRRWALAEKESLRSSINLREMISGVLSLVFFVMILAAPLAALTVVAMAVYLAFQ